MKFKIGDVVIIDRIPSWRGTVAEAYSEYWYWIRFPDKLGASFEHSDHLRLDDPFEQFVREVRFDAGLDKD